MFQATSDKSSEMTFHLWSSSDKSVSSNWVNGPQAQPIQPKQYL